MVETRTVALGWIGVAALFCLGSPAVQAGSYVFSTFTGDALADEQLSIYKSSDALDFTLVANTGFAGPSGALRDPSIMRHTDGRYYVAYTDPIGAGCCGKEDHFSIARSDDLVHWTNLTTVPGGVPGLAHVWAPEWFVDGATVMIVANIDTLNTDSDFKPYLFVAQDSTLTTWSGPTALGLGPNYIDTFVLKTNGTYHAFLKNETTRYVEHATAAKVTGPWTFVGTGNWAGWGAGMEGPCVTSLDDGSWRIYLDGQGAVGFLYADSRDLVTWSKTAPLPMLSNVVRHGTVFRDESLPGTGGTAGSRDAGVEGGTTKPPSVTHDGGPGGAGGDTVGGASAGGGRGATGGAGPDGRGGASMGAGGSGDGDADGSRGVGGVDGAARSTADAASADARSDSNKDRAGCRCAIGRESTDDCWTAVIAVIVLCRVRARPRRTPIMNGEPP
ncbi:MAG TPA: glycoside hydrolase family 43 protein [Polyangia bacterium]|nr:glycoside hydrolase family 43 protein [Polyangia bacterium]